MAYSDHDDGGGGDADYNGGYSDHDDNVVEYADSNCSTENRNYSILKEEDICRLLEEDISKICTTLSLPRGQARVLLLAYGWSVSKVLEDWFADEDKVWKAVGLLISGTEISKFSKNENFRCEICYDEYPLTNKHAASCGCGHIYCVACFKSWIRSLIDDGPGCLTRLRCPAVDCNAAVPEELVKSFAGMKTMTKYRGYLLRSYMEQNRATNLCSTPPSCSSQSTPPW